MIELEVFEYFQILSEWHPDCCELFLTECSQTFRGNHWFTAASSVRALGLGKQFGGGTMTDFNSKKHVEQNDTLPTWGWMQNRSIALAGAEDFRMWLSEQLDSLVSEHESWITPNSLKRELSSRGVAK